MAWLAQREGNFNIFNAEDLSAKRINLRFWKTHRRNHGLPSYGIAMT